MSNKILLNDKEINNLIVDYRDNKNEYALEKILNASKLYVEYFISKMHIRPSDHDDAMQEGLMGVLEAVNRYDVNADAKFSTYSAFWIRNNILRFIEERPMIVLPKYLSQRRTQILKEFNKMNATDYTDEVIAEIAERLELAKDEVVFALDAMKSFTSLDSSITDDNKSHVIDFVQSDIETPDAFIDSTKEKISILLKTLDSKDDKIIVQRYFGIGCKCKTFQEIGDEYHLSREAVRNRLNKILSNLHSQAISMGITL